MRRGKKERRRIKQTVLVPESYDVVVRLPDPDPVDVLLDAYFDAFGNTLGKAAAGAARVAENFLATGTITIAPVVDVAAQQSASFSSAIGDAATAPWGSGPITEQSQRNTLTNVPLVGNFLGQEVNAVRSGLTAFAGLADSLGAPVVKGIVDLSRGLGGKSESEQKAILGQAAVQLAQGVAAAIPAVGALASALVGYLSGTGEGQKVVAAVGEGSYAVYNFQRDLFQGDFEDAFSGLGSSHKQRVSAMAQMGLDRLKELEATGGALTDNDISGFRALALYGVNFTSPIFGGKTFAEWANGIEPGAVIGGLGYSTTALVAGKTIGELLSDDVAASIADSINPEYTEADVRALFFQAQGAGLTPGQIGSTPYDPAKAPTTPVFTDAEVSAMTGDQVRIVEHQLTPRQHFARFGFPGPETWTDEQRDAIASTAPVEDPARALSPVEAWAQTAKLAVAPPEPERPPTQLLPELLTPRDTRWRTYNVVGTSPYGDPIKSSPGFHADAWADLARMLPAGATVEDAARNIDPFIALWRERGVTLERDEAWAWHVNFLSGYSNNTNKTDSYYVRCVSSGP